MNGVAFADLPQLVWLGLWLNRCISKEFEIENGSKKFRRKISRNCGSVDVAKRKLSCSVTSSSYLDRVIRNIQAYVNLGCCEVRSNSQIDAPNYTFVADKKYATLENLVIIHQQNVEFLPISVHETFPNLKVYSVKNTQIQKISKKNFGKLSKLEVLNLDRNQIEVIKSDTFEDLVNLKWIFISKKLFSVS